MIHKHVLNGCQPTPLAHYLKALGILRLVAEQTDPACRGAWIDDHFVLATKLTKEELERFFLEEYKPTAFVAPWNKGSGFYQKNDPGLKPIEQSSAPRFQNWVQGIQASRALIGNITQADMAIRKIKDEAKKIKDKAERKKLEASDDYKNRINAANKLFKELKTDLLPDCRNNWRGSHLDWMQSAMALDGDGSPRFSSLLGSGGNDGRLDFTNNLMQRLRDLFDISQPGAPAEPNASSQLKTALWGALTTSNIEGVPIGQYFPGFAGGANNSTGTDGDSLVNPWDFVLMLEGAVLFSASATKRLNPMAQVQASAPFSLYSNATGMGSISDTEESQRGEQWMPLWNQWTSLAEIKSLFAEGRAQIGRVYAAKPVDMARAVSRLGVSRGIQNFVRYGYLERNGQANFAVPLGRIQVCNRRQSRLIDDLALWMDRLHRAARDKAPARLIHAERNLADAVFDALTHDSTPSLWQKVLLAAVEVEKIQVSGTGFEIGPIPRLSIEWLQVCNDDSVEFRLALALGSASIRCHWLPLDGKNPHKYATSDKRLAHDVRVVAHGRNAEDDLIAIVLRRSIESQQKEGRHPQILERSGTGVHLSDLAVWIEGNLDRERCVNLARAFMALDWKRWESDLLEKPTLTGDWPEDAWCALKLNALPWPLPDRDIPFDPAILRRLQSGDGAEALQVALHRLQAHDIRPALSVPLVDERTSHCWASALAFPISFATAKELVNRIQPQNKETSHVH